MKRINKVMLSLIPNDYSFFYRPKAKMLLLTKTEFKEGHHILCIGSGGVQWMIRENELVTPVKSKKVGSYDISKFVFNQS